MIPSIGRIVSYTLGEGNINEVNRRRATNLVAVHVGNPVAVGQVFPMIITRVWDTKPTEESVVQGQVFLDGNDTLWVASVKQGDNEYEWHETPDASS